MLTSLDLQSIERTLQLAIAPAFILGGIVSLLSLLTARLQRLADLHRDLLAGQAGLQIDVRHLVHRARLTYRAITCAIVAAVLLCILVMTAFIEPIAGITMGGHVAGLLLAAMLFLAASLTYFLREVLSSASVLPLRHDK